MHILRNKNVVILLSGQFISRIGNNLFSLALYWYVLSETHSRSALGFVGALASLATAVGLISGVFVDRWDRRRTMIGSDILRGTLALVLAVFALLHRSPVVLIASIILCIQAVGTFFSPAENSMLPQLVRGEELAEANGVNASVSSASSMIGLGLGGALLAFAGPIILFVANAVSFGVSVFSLLFLKAPLGDVQNRRPQQTLKQTIITLWNELADGYRLLLGMPFLRKIIPLAAMANFFLTPLEVLDVAWVRQVLHQGAFVYGLFGVALVVGSLAGGLMAGPISRRFVHRNVVLSGIALEGMIVMAFSQIPFAIPDLIMFMFLGATFSVLNSIGLTMIQQAIPDGYFGRILGPLVALNTALRPIGILLSGLIAVDVPLSWVFLTAGLLCISSLVLGRGMPKEVSKVVVQSQ